MKKRSFLSPLLLGLAVFAGSLPTFAGTLNPASADLLGQLEASGWQTVTPGVVQRTLADGKIETLGFGADGLRFQLQELEAHLAFLRKEYSLYPSRALRQTIRAQRAEVLRVQAALRKDADGGLVSSRESLLAEGTQCPVTYDATADAYPLTQGANASSSSSFDNDCGYTGEVYAHAYAKATAANNSIATMTLSDPAPNTSRVGTKVAATAAAGVSGVQDCYSYAYSSVISYDAGVSYSLSEESRLCSGTVGVRPFAATAPSNVILPSSSPLDPNSAAMVGNLNSYKHKASLYAYGRPVFDANAGTPRAIVCTKPWGTCDLSQKQVPIHASWKPSSGDGAMSVVDYTNRKVYDFYQVARNADGTVAINADGSVSVGWGSVVDLDGDGLSTTAPGLVNLFGAVRVYEIERAAADPANAIQHALAFSSPYICPTWRYPAQKSGGSSTVAGCIPMGTRVFLDSAADCSTVATAGEKAICYALRKYGAYAVASGGNSFGLYFETPTDGQPGGSGPDPYSGAGLVGDNYDLVNIPWSRLKVAADCRCSSSDLALSSGRPFAAKAASNLLLPGSPKVDVDSAAIVTNLNSSRHTASLDEYGISVFDASAGTPRTIVCTRAWGTCDVSQAQVPIHASWKPARGNGTMSVIDYPNRKIYDFYDVVRNADGTVKINADGTVSVGWGSISDLDGNGRSVAVSGSNLSYLFGTVRVFEMERAATDPANAIQHALGFTSKYACSTWRYPATGAGGTYAGTGCIPVGARIYLDSGADCSTVSPAAEKAVCYALQKYGAYSIGSGGSTFSFKLEVPTYGQAGGSGPDPYPGVGLVMDYYDMVNIPWSRLKVAADGQFAPY
ncbi:MAG TPA: hypothetical protein VJ725_26205 [Thermoanaerobaculia bacterium]|nr:hypothetical protein [Thermoanaerobaculia bacterium]